MKLGHNPLFCKQSKAYSFFGEALREEQNPVQRVAEEPSLLFGAVTNIQRTTHCDVVNGRNSVADTVVVEVARTAQEQTDKNACAEFIASCLSQGCTIDMLLENFIASVVTVYQEKCDPKTAKGIFAFILISTIGMTYTQYKLVIDGFIKARSGQTDGDNGQNPVLLKHQIQALIGTLSAIETGVRFFFNIMTVFNLPNAPLRYTFASIAGTGKLISFQMASSHKACDVPLSKTLVGKLVYGILTSPIMPDLIQYATISTPFIGAIMFSSAIFLLKDTFNVEHPALTAACYPAAFFSGMMAFLIQKCYICNGVMTKSLEKNTESIESWNYFWYGGSENTNLLQKSNYVIKRFIDLIALIPLTALDAVDQLTSVCCYFVLALLPIQFIAMVQYISQPALTYCVFFQIFNNAQGLLETYTGKHMEEPTPEMQRLLALLSLPFGIATAFTMLNLTGEELLKGTNKVFNGKVEVEPPVPTSETMLLHNSSQPSSGIYSRFCKVGEFAKNSIISVSNNTIARFRGKTL